MTELPPDLAIIMTDIIDEQRRLSVKRSALHGLVRYLLCLSPARGVCCAVVTLAPPSPVKDWRTFKVVYELTRGRQKACGRPAVPSDLPSTPTPYDVDLYALPQGY